MNRVAGRAGIVLLLALLLIVGVVFFVVEYTISADQWVIFPGSPHVYSGGRIGRGTVTDAQGTVLLHMSGDRTYADDAQLRAATVHWLGDRTGSVSAPALTRYAAELTGFDLINGVYSYGKQGGTAHLTINAQVQLAALEALGDNKGTVGVYNYETGQLLCAVTTPTFDPDNVPDLSKDEAGQYEGMYVNRFVQSTYTPGSVFKIVTLAAALESIADIESQSFECTAKYPMGVDNVTCETRHGKQSLKEAFYNSCNCAFAQISQQLGAETLTRYVQQFGVTDPVSFDGITTAKGNFDITDAAPVSVAWSSIGQYTDLINPCAFMNFIGAVASGGKGNYPYLVEQVGADDAIGYKSSPVKGDRLMSEHTANVIAEYMGYNVTQRYGSENFPGMTVCAKTGTAEVGGERKPNAVFTGFSTDDQYPLAFIVIVEDSGYGRTVCVPIMSKVLRACKAALDG